MYFEEYELLQPDPESSHDDMLNAMQAVLEHAAQFLERTHNELKEHKRVLEFLESAMYRLHGRPPSDEFLGPGPCQKLLNGADGFEGCPDWKWWSEAILEDTSLSCASTCSNRFST